MPRQLLGVCWGMCRAISRSLVPLTLSVLLALLAGCGSLTGPALSLSPEALSFSRAETKSVVVTNLSTNEITISSQSLGEPRIFELKDPEGCRGVSLKAGVSCTYEITVIKYERRRSTYLVVSTLMGEIEADIETS